MFTAECHPYCKRANKPELVLVGALLIYVTLCCVLSPGFYDANDIFKFYSLPFSFTFQLELVCLVCAVGYVLMLLGTRQVLAWYEKRRVVHAPYGSAVTLQQPAH